MIKNYKAGIIVGSLVMFMGGAFLPTLASAAISPTLGLANDFSILSSTYTNTAPGTTISGDLGYTTPPATAATVNGITHVADGAYNQAGIDQGSALVNLATQVCTFTFAAGAVDLASDITHGLVGVYAPGVYCIDGAASVGTGGITLAGYGTHIFRMTGALNTAANSHVTLANGATSCDVWWTPGGGTTLGANSVFAGQDIDASGVTIGNVVIWAGRALAFGGTVSTSRDIVSTPTCETTNGGDTGNGGGGESCPVITGTISEATVSTHDRSHTFRLSGNNLSTTSESQRRDNSLPEHISKYFRSLTSLFANLL